MLSARSARILETFAQGWPLEVCFRDVKQFLGFEDPQNRVSKATQRTAPLIFYIYDLTLLWHAQSGHLSAPQSTVERPWYNRKTSTSFEDILRNLRQATWQEGYSATPDWTHTREKSFNPLQSGSKLLHKSAKRQASGARPCGRHSISSSSGEVARSLRDGLLWIAATIAIPAISANSAYSVQRRSH